MDGAKVIPISHNFFIMNAPETFPNETEVLVSHRDSLFICKSLYKHHKTYYNFLPQLPLKKKMVKLKVSLCLCVSMSVPP